MDTRSTVTGTMRFTSEYDVSDVVEEPGNWRIRVGVVLPTRPTPHPIVFCCVPGGGYTGDYFDLQVPGAHYSFADSAAAAGFGCIMVDNLGTGRSTSSRDVWHSPDSLADANVHAFNEALMDIARRSPAWESATTIGLGHSMGAMLTILAQARSEQHPAVVSLGFTTRGLPQLLDEDELALAARGPVSASTLGRFTQRRFSQGDPAGGRNGAPFEFFRPDTDPRVLAALRGLVTDVPPLAGTLSFVPGNIADAASAVRVPVFVGGGDHEPWHTVQVQTAPYTASPDVTFFVTPDTAHNHFASIQRDMLWNRIFQWAHAIRRKQ